jgi:hypothetical protein
VTPLYSAQKHTSFVDVRFIAYNKNPDNSTYGKQRHSTRPFLGPGTPSPKASSPKAHTGSVGVDASSSRASGSGPMEDPTAVRQTVAASRERLACPYARTLGTA